MQRGEYDGLESLESQQNDAPSSVKVQHDIVFSAADSRYIGQPDNANGGDIILTANEVRRILECEADEHKQPQCMWLTSRQMGWSLAHENDKIVDVSRGEKDRPTRRCLAPAISAFIRPAYASET